MKIQLDQIFKAVDASNTEAFLKHLTDDAVFKFANIPAVEGKQNIHGFLEQFFESIDHTKHSNLETWQSEDANTAFAAGEVTYVRKDGSKLTVPFCNVFKLNANRDKIKDYLIYVDNHELYS